jgi:hypothetical protein
MLTLNFDAEIESNGFEWLPFAPNVNQGEHE